MNEQQLKAAFFEIFSAGFEVASFKEIDIVTAYDEYWDSLMKDFKEVY